MAKRFYYTTYEHGEDYCFPDHVGNIRGARKKAQEYANEVHEDVYINDFSTGDILDIIYPDYEEPQNEETVELYSEIGVECAVIDGETGEIKDTFEENPDNYITEMDYLLKNETLQFNNVKITFRVGLFPITCLIATCTGENINVEYLKEFLLHEYNSHWGRCVNAHCIYKWREETEKFDDGYSYQSKEDICGIYMVVRTGKIQTYDEIMEYYLPF